MNAARSKRQLQLATPSDREISMTRAFDAPRDRVFDAFTTPKLLQRWLLGPDGWSMPVCEVDLRPGGAFHYVWRNDADGNEFGLHGSYRAIERPERIVHVENFDQPWYPGDATITTTFVERDGVTTVTMVQAFDTPEGLQAALESGMETGVAASYDRLDEILNASTGSS
ncbi:MAG TPA: SRPBCC family protein [Candidatus Cybelea sp.]|jgi:uncharacterized protein YndB with AHSA1/START domain|nr:SRPBCC family protein [Candidatus Cybelea sp.]